MITMPTFKVITLSGFHRIIYLSWPFAKYLIKNFLSQKISQDRFM